MLGGMHFLAQRFERIALLDTHGGLVDDGAAIDLGSDVVHGTAGNFPCPIASSPGKLGNRLGCKLMIFPAKAAKNPGLITLMNPARTTRSGVQLRIASMYRCSPSPSSLVLNGAGSR